jgi:hypothetical protein
MHPPLSAPRSSRRSERGSSEASVGHALGHTPIGHRLLFVVDGRHSWEVGRLFAGWLRAPTRKKSQQHPWNP